MSQVLGVPNLYYLDKKAAGLLAAKYANRRRVYSHSNGTNDKVSYTFKHRRRTCDGYFQNSLRPIPYLRYVRLEKQRFLQKKNPNLFSHGPLARTTPLRQCGFWQCLPFSRTTLINKHCWHHIAIMGVVDTFGQ